MRHIPNILSVFRIVLIPFFVWQMLYGNPWIGAGILILSGATDLLDGFLARRFGWVSAVGKVLDPAADKLTQVTAYIVLAIKFPRYWYFFALLLFKELVMLVLGGWLLRKQVRLQGASWFGKVVTALFYVIAIALIFFPEMPGGLRIALLSLVTICAFAAGVMYIPQFINYRAQAKEGDAPQEKEAAPSQDAPAGAEPSHSRPMPKNEKAPGA